MSEGSSDFGALRVRLTSSLSNNPRSKPVRAIGRALVPGLDVHTRSRYRILPRFFRRGDIATLDAGCGNGALSYAAYLAGNRVLGVSNQELDINHNKAFYGALGTETPRLEFRFWDLRNAVGLDMKFDQIICSETIEHIRDDASLIRQFGDILAPGGVLHLCAPYALHPEHNLGRVDEPEDGRHVRDGYTLESFNDLLEPNGFRITRSLGIGSPILTRSAHAAGRIRKARPRLVSPVVDPLIAVMLLPVQYLDHTNPPVPFSLYVEARNSVHR